MSFTAVSVVPSQDVVRRHAQGINTALQKLDPFKYVDGSVTLVAPFVLTGAFNATGDMTLAGNLNLTSGHTVKVNSVQVLTARQTGWSADTGTDKRTANATYTAPTISATPTQAEVQAIANALQNASRTIKSLKADLTTHGIIGT